MARALKLPSDLFFDIISTDEVPAAYQLELSGYPVDEAESLETFQAQHSQAPDLFLGAFLPLQDGTSRGGGQTRTLIGFICSTLSPASTFPHAPVLVHIPEPGPSSVCSHSIVVARNYRNCGVGTSLLKEYIRRLENANATKENGKYVKLLFLTHEELRRWFEKLGFECVGKSDFVHGSRPWYEMRKSLRSAATDTPLIPAQSEQETTPALPPGLWEALQRPAQNRPVARSLTSFGGIQGVTEVASWDGEETKQNKSDLLCPHKACGSVILKKGSAKLIEAQSIELEPPGHTPVPPLIPMQSPSENVHWWLVTPNAMAFENIGFSRPIPSQESEVRKKFLICAECDLGPLGWCVEGGGEFWLVCDRVGYRA